MVLRQRPGQGLLVDEAPLVLEHCVLIEQPHEASLTSNSLNMQSAHG